MTAVPSCVQTGTFGQADVIGSMFSISNRAGDHILSFDGNSKGESEVKIRGSAFAIVLILTGTVGLDASEVARASAIPLVEAGKPVASIVVAQEPTPAARLAAVELQLHLEKITGATLPIVTDELDVSGARILVGESKQTRELGLSNAGFQSQEYLIGFRPNTIILMGRDWHDTPQNRTELGRCTYGYPLDTYRKQIDYHQATGRETGESDPITLPGLFDDQGTCYATYDFLERFCGVRWYGPSEINLVFPRQSTLVVPSDQEIRRLPDLKHRHATGGSWPILHIQWDKPTEDQLQLYWRRLRVGGEKWAGNHTIWRNTVRDIFNDPEYQAVGAGQGSQLCLSHPKLVRAVAQAARDFFDGRALPDGLKAMGDYFAVVPDDNASWCECPRCGEIMSISRRDERGKGFFSNARDSYYVFHFVNEVAKEVQTSHPDKFIVALAYASYAYRPEGLSLETNLCVAPCLHTCYGYDRATSQNDLELYQSWVSDSGRRVYLWNYFHHPMEPAVIQNWNCFPCFMPDVISQDVQRFCRDGVRGVFLCGIGQQLDYYLYMQMALDADRDYQKIVDEFFRLYFGSAEQPMKRFYDRVSQINRDEGVVGRTPQLSWERLGTASRMTELEDCIQLAVQSAQGEVERRRVETWRKGVWEYMQTGRRQYLEAAGRSR